MNNPQIPTEDQRPAPNPRQMPHLWQAYLWWDELVQMRKRHLLRISSIKARKSTMDAQFERDMMDHMGLDALVRHATRAMVKSGSEAGLVWEWIRSIKGMKSGSLPAQLLAQIDDIGKFATVSKLWRFSGWAVRNGRAETNVRGEKSHYNRRLKSTCFLIGEQFIRQQTPLYSDLYYEFKAKLREKHPEKIKGANGKWKYNDGHIDRMARRKMIKIFLQHLWLMWRTAEGLPTPHPYIHDIGGHSNLIPPPNSHVVYDCLVLNASQSQYDAHVATASHLTCDTPVISASHTNHDAPDGAASQKLGESQIK